MFINSKHRREQTEENHEQDYRGKQGGRRSDKRSSVKQAQKGKRGAERKRHRGKPSTKLNQNQPTGKMSNNGNRKSMPNINIPRVSPSLIMCVESPKTEEIKPPPLCCQPLESPWPTLPCHVPLMRSGPGGKPLFGPRGKYLFGSPSRILQ